MSTDELVKRLDHFDRLAQSEESYPYVRDIFGQAKAEIVSLQSRLDAAEALAELNNDCAVEALGRAEKAEKAARASEAARERLAKALEPFAKAAAWMNGCLEEDRQAYKDSHTIHVATRAFSSGFTLMSKWFYDARAALASAPAKPEGRTADQQRGEG